MAATSDPQYVVGEPLVMRSVLFRHNREKSWEYENRRKRAHYINFVQPVTKSLVSHATKKPAIREGSDALTAFWKGVDYKREESISDFMRDGLRWAQVEGVMWACVDQKPKTADEPENDGKPYAYWVNPLDIMDWGVDDDGCIEWLKQFVYTEQARTWDQPIVPVYRFRIWTKKDVSTFEVGATGGPVQVGETRGHSAGQVPFVPLFSQEDKEAVFPDGIPIMGDACKVANAIFNYGSLRDEILYKQTFSWLCIPDKNVDKIAIGLNTAFGYDPMSTNAVPTYVSPDADQVRVLAESILSGLEQLRQMLGVGRGRTEGSMQKQSADALELENEDKRSILGDIASEAQRFEHRLAKMFEAYGGNTSLKKVETRIEYPADFDLRSFTDEVMEYLNFKQVGLSPEVDLKAKEDLVSKRYADLPRPELDALIKSLEMHQQMMMSMQCPPGSMASMGPGSGGGGGAISVGTRIMVIPGKEHMPEHKGVPGTVKIVQNGALGIKFDGIPGIHKWYAPDEVEVESNSVDNPGSQGHGVGAMGNTTANRPPAGPRQPQPPMNAGAATGAVEPGQG